MKEILQLASSAIGALGAVIIAWGVLLTIVRLVVLEVRRFNKKSIYRERETLRHQMGSYLLLGLEFLIAADIVVTIANPTLIDVAILGSIVLIRTLISYFLEQEIAEFVPPEED